MILEEIIKKKEETLKEFKKKFDIKYFEKRINFSKKVNLSFFEAMKKEGLSIIGEVKKASPSKGIIKEDFDYIQIAKKYLDSVDAISVLTEEHFFLGSPKYLEEISSFSSIPVLRKDFIIDPIQIYEAKALGASAVLLIMSVLDDKTLTEFLKITKGLKMDALVEVHDEFELERALNASSDIIGINNRNLRDFTIDLNLSVKLSKFIPKSKAVIAESGINDFVDIKALKDGNIDGILVGECFMKSKDIKQKAEEFRNAFK